MNLTLDRNILTSATLPTQLLGWTSK